MVEQAHRAGMPREQVESFVKAGYVPLPAMMPYHAAARQADSFGHATEIAMGGSRGPGKSYAVMAQVGLDDCQRVPELKWLFLRKVMKSAAESMDDLTRKVFRFTPHTFTAGGVEFPNGSRILIGGYKDERDIDKYLGLEYDGIVIEEATQLTEDRKEKIRGSMRSTKPGWRPRMYLSTNADGVGLAWFKRQYVTPAREGRESVTRFFQLSYRDNPFLDAEYVKWLDGLAGPLGKAWRDADWDAFAGMAFPMWNHERHVVTPFEIPQHWAKWRATDWGFASPFCTVWLAKDPDTKRIYVYRELYAKEMTDRQQARTIKDMTPPTEQITIHYADPSLWERKNRNGEVFSTADEYKAEGILLTRADNDRLGGKRKLNNVLADLPDGKPGLQVFDHCAHVIEQVETLAVSKVNPEDVDTDAEDHAYDAVRYGMTNEKKPQMIANAREQAQQPERQRNPMNQVSSLL
jgi:PBSX family phage terminase large subunit